VLTIVAALRATLGVATPLSIGGSSRADTLEWHRRLDPALGVSVAGPTI
jgi:hypothetical protein